MGFRRKRVEKWPKGRWLQQIDRCYVSSPDEGGTKATIVVHMDRALLPRNAEDEAKLECLEAGVPWEGWRDYAVFCLECSPLDYAGYRMGDTVHEFMKDLYREVTVQAAFETSKEWIGSEPIETDLKHVPGLFKAAFLADITGKEPNTQGAESVWILPISSGPEQVVRYPIVTD